jgi:hypothetical protein
VSNPDADTDSRDDEIVSARGKQEENTYDEGEQELH